MDVTCESCRASYRVDDAKIPDKGIKAKCPKCGHSFLLKKGAAAPPPDEAIPVGDDEPPPPPPPASVGGNDGFGASDTFPNGGFGGTPEGFGAPPPMPDFGGVSGGDAGGASDPFASFGAGAPATGGVFGAPEPAAGGGGVFGGGAFGSGGFDSPAPGDVAGLGGAFQAKTAFEIRRTSGQEIGPFDMFHIKQMIYEQQLDGSESICDSNGNWVAITSMEELGEIFRLTGGAAAAAASPAPRAENAPSKPSVSFVPHESAARAKAADEARMPLKTAPSAPMPAAAPAVAIDTVGKRTLAERGIIVVEHVWTFLKTPIGRVVGVVVGGALLAALIFVVFKKQIYHVMHWDTQMQAAALIVDADKMLGSGESGPLATAQQKYRSAVQLYPKGVETHARLAEIDANLWWRDPIRLDLKTEAETELATATALSANDPAVVRASAAVALAKHDLALADAKAKVAVGLGGANGDPIAAAISGDAALEKGDLAGAEASYKLAAQKFPALGDTGLARVKVKAGDFAGAKGLADTVLKAEPDNGIAQGIAAYAGLHTGGDIGASRAKLREIAAAPLRFGQDRARAEFFLGLLSEESSQAAAALGHYRESLGFYPSDPEAVAAARRLFSSLHPDHPLDKWLAAVSKVRGSKSMGKIVKGEAAYAQHDWQGAMSPLLDASTEDPGSARALIAFGRLEAAIGGNETAKAKDFFNKAIAADPDYADAYVELSRFDLAQKDIAGARQAGEKAIAIDPTRPENYEAAAAAAVAGRDPAAAEKWLVTATQIDPDDYVTWMNLGEARRLTGNAPGALDPLQKACDLKKDVAEPRIRLGNAWEDIGDLKKAADAYTEAAKLEPDNIKVATRAGVVMVKNGDYTAGKKALEALLALHSEIAEAHFFLGISYQYTAEPEKALDSYRQAIKREYPDAYLAHYHSAELLAQPGAMMDKDAARDHLHEAIKLKPDFYQSHELLADIALAGNEYDEALRELRAVDDATAKMPASQRQPILERVKLKQGRIATKQGKISQAEKLFNDVLKINPKSAEALTHLGDLYKENEPKKAKGFYLKAINANPSYYVPYKPLGFLLKDDGDDCGAKNRFKKYLELSPNPDSDDAKEVRDALKDLSCDR